MQRLILRRFLVLSHSQKKSIEVKFEEGLNIIVGGNKTGKSSLIKSIFDCLGGATKIENAWKDIVSATALLFTYGQEGYCVIKRDTTRDFFTYSQNMWHCIVSTSEFHIFNSALMKELDMQIPCIPSKGHCEVIPSSVLFALQYIDQDSGWNGIAKSFVNSSNTKEWKQLVQNLVSGFHNEDYFIQKAELTRLNIEKKEKTDNHEMNLAFYERLKASTVPVFSLESPQAQEKQAKNAMVKADQYQKEMIELEAKTHETERIIYKALTNQKLYQLQAEEIKKDALFALNNAAVLVCPCCGARYENGLSEHLELCEDISICENALSQIDREIQVRQSELVTLHQSMQQCRVQYGRLQRLIQESQDHVSHEEYIKHKGKKELLNKGEEDLNKLEEEIDSIEKAIKKAQSEIRKLSSKNRRKQINDSITRYCVSIAEMIQYPAERVQIKSFMQRVDETGSDLPKCIYMYYVAMYLYNLNRAASPFNFLVVDTPNQQGQDSISMESILSTLDIMTDKRGQFILCTERETGYEAKASTVLKLNKIRECLVSGKYEQHAIFFKSMLDICM